MSDTPTILVVDDNDLDVERIQRSVRRLALDVDLIRAVDGLDALEFLQRRCEDEHGELPDLVLLDLNMPRMTGVEFLDCVRDVEPLATLPVIIVSTSSRPSDIELARSQGAVDYIVKPLLDEQLSALVTRARMDLAG